MNGKPRNQLWTKPFLFGLVLMGLPKASMVMGQTPGSNAGTTPRFAVVGLPTPIASSTPPPVVVETRPAANTGAPRLLDLEGPPVISTTTPQSRPSLNPGLLVNQPAGAPIASTPNSPGQGSVGTPLNAGQASAQTVSGLGNGQTTSNPVNSPFANNQTGTNPTGLNSTGVNSSGASQTGIVQTQGSMPITASNSGSLPKPFVSQPGTYSPPPTNKPSLFSNISNTFNRGNPQPFQTVAPPTQLTNAPVTGTTTRLAPVPMDGQVISQPTISGNSMVIQGNQQPWFGQRVWEWMNPNPRDGMGVTTLPVTPLPEGAIITSTTGGPMEGPTLVGHEGRVFSNNYMDQGVIYADGGMGGRCNPQPKWFLDAEVLLWFINGQQVPALVTQGSVLDARPGALGQPNTNILSGGGYLPTDFAAGGRFTAGYWFGTQNIIGIDAQYFFLGQVENNYVYEGFGVTQTVGRPFTNALNGIQQAEQVYQPAVSPNPQGNSVAGSVTVRTLERFDGATANLRWGLIRRPRFTTDIQTGFRWQQFNEELGIVENLANTSPNERGGFLVNDQFQTFNNFYGGNFSALNTFQFGRISLGLNGKLGVGITNQQATIRGYTLINDNGVVNSYPGGLLTQKSNIGTYQQSVFAVVPEMEFNVGYQLSQRLRFTVGYNLIYWSNVARPGGLIDTTVNPEQIPPAQAVTGPQRPAFNWNNQDLWIMGANIGLEYKY